MELDLGGIHCLIEHVGGDHADDSSVVYVKEDKVLFLGDCLYPDYKGDRWRYTVKGTQALLNRLEKYDADLYVLSHDIPLSKTQFRIYADLLKLKRVGTKIGTARASSHSVFCQWSRSGECSSLK
jgi:glyoxylase-like metal-dependent hydrolase (beta-lactamase superfamily II)